MSTAGKLVKASMTDLFQSLTRSGNKIRVEYITGHWLEVDNKSDLLDAQKFL